MTEEITPKLRPDLLAHVHTEPDGSSSFVLEDPVGNKFFRVSSYEYDLLSILDGRMTLAQAVDELRLLGRHYTMDFARKLVEQFSMAGLLLGTGYSSSTFQTAFRSRMSQQKKQRLAFKLYFMYLPLFNPDRFLEKTIWIWRLIANRYTFFVFLALVPGAMYLLLTGFHRIENQFLFFFNDFNLLVLWLAIAAVKLVHELAHAYTAKSYGLHVPEMGVALLIFFPCLYCNTTAAWRLANRKQRMGIALAGMIAEAVIAVICSYVWYFSKPGLVNSLAFHLTVISLLSSILFNSNPLIKFDGYYVLTDLLHIVNLQAKANNALKFLFQNRALGMESVSMPHGTGRDHLIFVIYGVLDFLYRFILYGGIVSGVYYKFDKTLGVVLGGLALGLFIIRPVAKSLENLVKRRREINFRPKGVVFVVCILAALTYLLTQPISEKSVYPCYVDSAMSRKLVIAAEAPVKEVLVMQNDVVRQSSPLFRLDGERLEFNLREKETQVSLVKREISIIENDEKGRSRVAVKFIELSQTEDAVSRIQEQLQGIETVAPFDGAITRLSSDIQPGAEPGKGVEVGEISSRKICEVVGIAPEGDVSSLQVGAPIMVWFPVGTGVSYRLSVREINAFKAEDLEGSPLSSRFGGEIATTPAEETSRDAPLEPQYLCKMDFDNTDLIPLGMTGRMVVEKPPRSLLKRLLDIVYKTFNREIIF